MHLCMYSNVVYGQWQASGLIRDGSSMEDEIYGVFKPVQGQTKVIACGTLGASDMPGVSGKGLSDAFVGVYENGVFTQIKTFGGSRSDGFNGGLAIHANQYVFWGQTASDDGDITSNPMVGVSCGWIVFTDSLLNVTGSYTFRPNGSMYGSTLMGGLNAGRNVLVFVGRYRIDLMTGEQGYWVLFTDMNGQTIFESRNAYPGVTGIANHILVNLSPDSFLLTAQFIEGGSSPRFSNVGEIYVWDSVFQEFDDTYDYMTNLGPIDDAFTGYTQKDGIHYFLGASSSCSTSATQAIKLTKFDNINMQEIACNTHSDAMSYKHANMIHLQDLNMVFTASYYSNIYQSEGKVWMGHTDSLGNISASTTFGGTNATNAIASYFDFSGTDNEIIIAGNTHATDGDFSTTTPRGGSDFWIARFVNPTLSLSPEANNEMKVYPNPVSVQHGFFISHEFIDYPEVSLTDMNGKVIPIQIQHENKVLHCIPNHAIAPGCYFISIQNEHKRGVSKIILQP
jgi:hypothetical protein